MLGHFGAMRDSFNAHRTIVASVLAVFIVTAMVAVLSGDAKSAWVAPATTAMSYSPSKTYVGRSARSATADLGDQLTGTLVNSWSIPT